MWEWSAPATGPARRTRRGSCNAPGADLTAVWGRDPAATNLLAERHGATSFADFDDFLRAVDAVSFAVPPHVQAPLAVRASDAGKHLLLEKPIALDEQAGDEIAASVQASGVAALVFFTHLFAPPSTRWFSRHRPRLSGSAETPTGWDRRSSDDNPFNTPWRREYGGLWDVGPHAVADLTRALGPVVTRHRRRRRT